MMCGVCGLELIFRGTQEVLRVVFVCECRVDLC